MNGGFFPKKPGFASKVGKGVQGAGKRTKAMSKPNFIKGPRQSMPGGAGGVGKP